MLASATPTGMLRILKTNLLHFSRLVSQWLSPLGSLSTIEETENLAGGINRVLKNALKAVSKRANKKSGRGAPWWTSECESAHLNYRQVMEEHKRSKWQGFLDLLLPLLEESIGKEQ